MAFFLEEELLVAGNAFGERVGSFIGKIERSGDDGVDSGHSSRECFGLAAQKVHMGIVDGLVETRSRCADVHLGSISAFGLVLFHNPGPEHTCGTELGNFHEEIAAHAHVELYACCHFTCTEAGVGESCHPCGTPCQCISHFLVYICTAVAEHSTVDTETTQSGHGLYNVKKFGSFCYDGSIVDAFHTVAELTAQRIVLYRATEAVGGAGCNNILHQCFGDGNGIARAALEVDFYFSDVDILQENCHVGGVGNLEAKRCNTFGQHISGNLVGGCGTVGDYVLAGEPVVIVAGATNVWELAGEAFCGFQRSYVFGAVYGLHIEAFVSTPHQFLIEVGTFKVGFHLGAPLLVARLRELVEQSFFIFCHSL